MSSFAPLGGGGGAITIEDLEFSDGVKQGYEVTSVYIDTNKRIGKGGSKEVFLTQNRAFASEIKEFKVFKKLAAVQLTQNHMSLQSCQQQQEKICQSV